MEKREKAQSQSVDVFFKENYREFIQSWDSYMPFLVNPNALVLRYEDIVVNPARFEQQIGSFLGINVPEGSIVTSEDFTVQEENIHKHKRQVKSGDFQRKLMADTRIWAESVTDGFMVELMGYNAPINNAGSWVAPSL